MYLFYAFAPLEPILDSVVIKLFIYDLFTIYIIVIRDMCYDILMILLYICVT
jgi:hypothetical protein